MFLKVFFLVVFIVGIHGFGYDDCNAYSDMEAKAKCGADGYVLDYGLAYCHRFFTPEFYDNFDAEGKKWVQCVGQCLIKATQGIVDEQVNSGNIDCGAIKKEAFGKHVDCYVNCGFCDICANNRLALFKVYNWADFTDPLAIQQIYDVIKKCGITACLWDKNEEFFKKVIKLEANNPPSTMITL
uniref:Uncharacterized protein n=1 Tax=Panagrolaimus sp. JU765 TaxID=591449 RepID=A0AC34Q0E3_9BILA